MLRLAARARLPFYKSPQSVRAFPGYIQSCGIDQDKARNPSEHFRDTFKVVGSIKICCRLERNTTVCLGLGSKVQVLQEPSKTDPYELQIVVKILNQTLRYDK
jgi:hypothetical protein